MVFILIDDSEDLERSFLEHILHSLVNLGAFYSPSIVKLVLYSVPLYVRGMYA